jgi:hypothetical protein
MSFLSAIGHYFEALGKSLLGQLKVSVQTFLQSFVVTDLGKLAIDAVTYAEDTVKPTGADSVAIRDAAIAKFKTDAAAAGHDIAAFGQSLLVFLVESAYQAFQASAGAAVVAAL